MRIEKEKTRDKMIGVAFVLITLMFLLLVSIQVTAQPRHENHNEEVIERSKNISIGLRNGYLSGFSIECEGENYSLENIIKFNRKTFNQTILYKRLKSHSTIKGLKAFAGIGAHYYRSQENFNYTDREDLRIRNSPNLIGYEIIGIDVVMGLSYKLNKLPISFSLDIKPAIELFATNLTNYCFYYNDSAGITIRYII